MNSKRLFCCLLLLIPFVSLFSQTTLTFGPEAGSQTYSVNTPYNWSVTDDRAWITVTPSSGTGAQAVTVSVTANASTSARSGTITISVAGTTKLINVTQEGMNLAVSPATLTFDSGSASKTFSITSNIHWNISDDATWITVSPTSGADNTSITVTVAVNPTTHVRSGTVTVTGGGLTSSVSIMQNGATLVVSPSSLSFSPKAASQTFSISSPYTWSISDDAAWVTVSPTSGAGDATIAVTVSANTTPGARTATVSVTGGGVTKVVTITQAEVALSVSYGSITFSSSPGTITAIVTCNIDWIVTIFDAWISVSPASGSGNGVVTISVPINNLTSSRSGTIAISAWSNLTTIAINQGGATPFLVVAPTYIPFVYSGGNGTISVGANIDWTVTDDADWVTVTPTNGTGAGTLSVSVPASRSIPSKSATITISGAGITQTVSVFQAGAYLHVSPLSLSFNAGPGSANLTIAANANWTVVNLPSWVSVSPTSGSATADVTVSVEANRETSSRTCQIIVAGTGDSHVVFITQQGASPDMSVTPAVLFFQPEKQSARLVLQSNAGWRATADASWISISPDSGRGNASLGVSVPANDSTCIRFGTITLSGDGLLLTIKVVQQALASARWCSGYALIFDGVDDYVNCGNDSCLAMEKQFTLCAWIFRQSVSNNWERIISKSDGRMYDYWLQLKPYESSVSGGFIEKEGLAAKHLDGISGTAIPLNEWVHLAISYDGSQLAGYLNGVLDKSRAVTGLIQSSKKPLFIGRLQNSYNFNGMIDEISVWNRALSVQEIREHMHCKYPANLSNLVAQWHFDEGTGDILWDHTIHKNHGTIYGAAWTPSTVPVADGTCQTKIVDSTGIVEFGQVNLAANFYEKNKIDTFVVSMLECKPLGQSPAGVAYYDSSQYWIIEQFGKGEFGADVTFYLKKKLPGRHDHNQLSRLFLFTRPARSQGPWTMVSQALAATDNSILFPGIRSTGQFIIGTNYFTFAQGDGQDQKGMTFVLEASYPNPFNKGTSINYSIPEIMDIHLAVYNIHGQMVRLLEKGRCTTGRHQAIWNGLDDKEQSVGSGLYFIILRAGGNVLISKCTLLK